MPEDYLVSTLAAEAPVRRPGMSADTRCSWDGQLFSLRQKISATAKALFHRSTKKGFHRSVRSDCLQKLKQRIFVRVAQRLVPVPRLPRLSTMALDGLLYCLRASIVQEMLAEAKSHQEFRAKFRWMRPLPTDVGKLGTHILQQ